LELQEIQQQARAALQELLTVANLRPGQIVVIGCSTSEINGGVIGKNSSPDIAAAIYEPFAQLAEEYQVKLAFQCCEHLNRALVVDEDVAERERLTVVHAVPHAHAGGSMAAHAYRQKKTPVLVENIQAHAGLDIGLTMIGMHLRPVAVPLRLQHNRIGAAQVCGAATRPKLIGGERAIYTL